MAKTEGFIKKLKFKYKLTILNENTLEEAWHIRLSRLNVFLFCFAIAVIYFFIVAFLIFKTPLRTFLPGYTDANILRKQVMSQALVVDSLKEEVAKNEVYLAMLTRVVSGDIETMDSTTALTGLVQAEIDKVKLDPSERENKFCSEYEIQQRYSSEAIITDESKRMLMHRPSLGVILKSYDSSQEIFGVTMTVEPMASVYATLDGHVIFAGYSAHNRYCMQIQHADNLITTYKFTHPFLKKIGDVVKAGEILATQRDTSATEVTFEMWMAGRPVNPQEYISFSKDKPKKEEATGRKKRERVPNSMLQEDGQPSPIAPVQRQRPAQPAAQPAQQPTETQQSSPAPKQETTPAEKPAEPQQTTPAPKPAETAPAPTPAPAPTSGEE